MNRKERSLFYLLIQLFLQFVTPESNGLEKFLFITSESRNVVLQKGQNVDLVCSFNSSVFNLYKNPLMWKKRQLDEETQVNLMVNLVEPFLSTNRFKSLYEPNHPQHSFKLFIRNVQEEDSGNYSCQIANPKNVLVTLVSYHVIVQATLDPRAQVIITQRNLSSTASHLEKNRQLHYMQDRPDRLVCLLSCPYPPISLLLTFNNQVLNGNTYQSILRKGPKGLRTLHYTVYHEIRNMTFTHLDDEKLLSCSVWKLGSKISEKKTKISVSYPPIITCDNILHSSEKEKSHIRCSIKANPPSTNVLWQVDGGLFLKENQRLGMFFSDSKNKGKEKETKLYIEDVKKIHFRSFVISASNSLAFVNKTVNIKLDSSSHKYYGQPHTGRHPRKHANTLKNRRIHTDKLLYGFGKNTASANAYHFVLFICFVSEISLLIISFYTKV